MARVSAPSDHGLKRIKVNLNFFSIDSYDLPITSYIERDEVVHVALVWSNDGRFMDNGDTIRLYIGGILICASKVTWSVGDTKSAIVKLGGATTQMAHNKDAYGSAIFENLKIYNFCKNEFNLMFFRRNKKIMCFNFQKRNSMLI